MTLIIGLTGSIGTGKSTVADRMKELNIPIVDADIIAREVVEPGKVAHEKIREAFGDKVFFDDDTLNRKALGEIIFNDPSKRKLLNEIIHPEIRKEMLLQRDRYVEEDVKCVVLDIPLLFESKLTSFVEKIIVVATDEATQLERLISRDNSSIETAQSRIQSQIPISEKRALADAVINNNGTKEASYAQLEEILKSWKVLY